MGTEEDVRQESESSSTITSTSTPAFAANAAIPSVEPSTSDPSRPDSDRHVACLHAGDGTLRPRSASVPSAGCGARTAGRRMTGPATPPSSPASSRDLLVPLGILLSLVAATAWVLIGPVVEAAYAERLPGPLGDLLSGFIQRREARTSADYVGQVRDLLAPHLILLGGIGAMPSALKLDVLRAGRLHSREIAPIATGAIVVATCIGLFIVSGPRFALHAAAGFVLLATLARLAAVATQPDTRAQTDLLVGPVWRRWEPWSIVGLVTLAAAMRLPRIGLLDPYTDEYYHLMAAQELLTAGSTDYQRAPLVTLLVTLAFAVSGATGFEQLVAVARIPFAIVGALTVIPVVLIGRRIDRGVGVVSGLLWALSPWAIGVSRTVREYALYPLLALAFTVALMTLARSDASRAARASATVTGVAFLSYLALDRSSTLAVGAAPALIATVVTVVVDRRRGRTPRRPPRWRAVALATIMMTATGFVLLLRADSTQTGLSLRPEYLRVFLAGDGSPLHWWGSRGATPLFVLVLLLAGAVAARATGTLHRTLPALTATALPLLGLVVLLDRYFSARYSSALLPWFTVLIAGSVVAIIRLIRSSQERLDGHPTRLPRRWAVTAAALLLVVAFRPYDPIREIWSTGHGERLTTGEFHDPVRGFLATHGEDLTAAPALIIVEHLARAMQVAGIRAFDDSHHYDYRSPERFDDAAAVMGEHQVGLMVLDARRNGGWTPGYPRSDFTVSGGSTIEVQLLSDDGYLQLYRWSTNGAAAVKQPR